MKICQFFLAQSKPGTTYLDSIVHGYFYGPRKMELNCSTATSKSEYLLLLLRFCF
ncbi:hypothetical protein P355_2442 [Burkholderia cenocepacia KC-01]|nr:hypothetical protein P355_2442 [Burkholderia cenocepacia KC-01]